MDNKNRIQNSRPYGADMRRVAPKEVAVPMSSENTREMREAYTQMSLRPMTAMSPQRSVSRPASAGQRPTQRPAPMGQRPAQRPAPVGQRPTQRPAPAGQRPAQRPAPAGQRPAQRPAPAGQRPAQRPAPMGQRPAQRPAPMGQRPAQRPTHNKGAAPSRKREWIVPEGSAVYSAEGIMYERARPNQSRPPQRPLQKKKKIDKEKLLRRIKKALIRFGAIFLTVAILFFWWYESEFCSDLPEREGEISFTMADMGSYTALADDAYVNDVLYIDFTAVSKWMGMVSVGSIGCMRFVCTDGISDTSNGKGGEEYVIFTDGSATCVINGVNVAMDGECRVVSGNVWVPLSFAQYYIEGIEVKISANSEEVNLVPLVEETEGEEKSSFIASFKVKYPRPISRVEYPQ